MRFDFFIWAAFRAVRYNTALPRWFGQFLKTASVGRCFQNALIQRCFGFIFTAITAAAIVADERAIKIVGELFFY